MPFHLAELNVARMRHPLDAPESAEFTSVLDAVNAIAEVSPGFVWRLKDDDGKSSSYVNVYDDPLMLINLSVWTDVESLRHFAYRSGHSSYLRRKTEWFDRGSGTDLVCWWVPAGELPSPMQAVARLEHLRANGPTDHAFPLGEPRPAPEG